MTVPAREDGFRIGSGIVRKENRFSRDRTARPRHNLDTIGVPTEPEGCPRSIQAVERIPVRCRIGDLDVLLSAAAAKLHWRPNAFWSLVRSKPMMTSPSTRITGTVAAPGTFSWSSFIAVSSSAMSLVVKGTPFAVKNSLAALQDPQVGVEKTSTLFDSTIISLQYVFSAYLRMPEAPRTRRHGRVSFYRWRGFRCRG